MESVKLRMLFLQLFLLFFSYTSIAQRISNVRADQEGQDIVIRYTLHTIIPCGVTLSISIDNGVSWSEPLFFVFGDVGKMVSSGEKRIVWKVLEEREKLEGDKIRFKVAIEKKQKTTENRDRYANKTKRKRFWLIGSTGTYIFFRIVLYLRTGL